MAIKRHDFLIRFVWKLISFGVLTGILFFVWFLWTPFTLEGLILKFLIPILPLSIWITICAYWVSKIKEAKKAKRAFEKRSRYKYPVSMYIALAFSTPDIMDAVEAVVILNLTSSSYELTIEDLLVKLAK